MINNIIHPFDAPCIDCKKRFVGCHSKCKKYKEWKAAIDERRANINKRRKSLNDINDYQISQKIKVKKYKQRRR